MCCLSDFRSQGMSRHGIDPQSQNIPSPASEELRSSDSTYKNYYHISNGPMSYLVTEGGGGGVPSGPVMQSFYLFFGVSPIKLLSRPLSCQWVETP